MEVENVSGVCFTSRRSADEEGERSVSHGVLREVVVDYENVLALRHEVFRDSAAGVRRCV